LAITGTPGTESQVGVYYVSHFVASGGTSPYSFSLAAGELPHGLSLASDGTISGTPDTVGVASGLQVKVTDAASASALSGVFSITVSPQPQLLISGDPATSARVGENYTATFTAFDGSGAGYSFTLASGTLPPGLSLSTVDGVSARISGMPTHVGTYGDISIQVTDSRENTAVSQTFSITVAPVAGPALAVSGAPGPAEIGNAYSVSFMATGGTQVGYVFDIASGAVPSGLTLAANGTLSGIPDAAGTYSFSVRVADSSADTVSTTDSINVASPIQLAVSLPEAAQGTSYSYQLAPTGGQTPYSFAVTSGSLPSGLSLDQATGIISGAPSTVGTYPVTVQVTDSEGRSATAEASLIVYAPIQISGAPPAAATVGVAYFAQFSATGGNGKPSFATASGALPAWLTLDSATGRLSGTPTAGNVGTVGPLKVSVTDGSRIALSAPFSISVATLPVMAGNPTQVTQGSAYSFDLATLTTGGTAPYAFSIKSGVLPTGMSRSASGGHSGNLVTASAVTGTTQTVTIHVVDAASRAGDYSMQFTVASPPTSNAWAWGNNSSGVYGNGTTNSGLVPVHVVGPDFVKVAIAANHACGITADGAAYCWGSNSVGQLGDGSGLNRLSPTLVSGLSSGVTDISVSNDGTTCAIQDGRGLCWGRGNDGQIGDGAKTDRSVPSQVSGLTSGVTSISAGQSSIACAVQAGAAKCWGNNGLGSIGDNTFTNRLTPVQVSGLTSGVTAVAAGTLGACAIVSGAAKCWGYNGSGQIGDGTTTNRAAPVQVSGLTSGVTQISMSYNGGSDTTCAVVSGAAKCWGYNGNGQIGDGTNTQRLTPTQVNGLTSGVTSVSVGKSVGCAVVSGSVKCWGANSNGQIGNGTTSTSLTPVQTTNLTSGISEISVGQQAVIAR
jgi:alpha-tubulin suppressor-like RCC1 family protein